MGFSSETMDARRNLSDGILENIQVNQTKLGERKWGDEKQNNEKNIQCNG